MSKKNFNRQWFEENDLQPIHKNKEIRQVYCWLTSADNKLALVSKDEQNWQLPGGHPEDKESIFDTLDRELKEELGIDLEQNIHLAKLFGYYLITEYENNDPSDKYLQLRFYLPLRESSDQICLQPNLDTKEQESEKVHQAKWVTIDKALEMIDWLKDSKEYKTFLKIKQ